MNRAGRSGGPSARTMRNTAKESAWQHCHRLAFGRPPRPAYVRLRVTASSTRPPSRVQYRISVSSEKRSSFPRRRSEMRAGSVRRRPQISDARQPASTRESSAPSCCLSATIGSGGAAMRARCHAAQQLRSQSNASRTGRTRVGVRTRGYRQHCQVLSLAVLRIVRDEDTHSRPIGSASSERCELCEQSASVSP